jgi:hypothetical protein
MICCSAASAVMPGTVVTSSVSASATLICFRMKARSASLTVKLIAMLAS